MVSEVLERAAAAFPDARIKTSAGDHGMESVRTGLRQIMNDLLRTRPAEEAVSLAWPLVCGKEVAARTRPLSFTEGRLIVAVPDATWRNQLQSFVPRYINGFEGLLGQVVKEIQFEVKQSAFSHQPPAKADAH